MSDADHIELAKTLRSLKGMVILSGYDSPLYSSLYTGWQIDKKRTIYDGNGERTEVLFISPVAAGRTRQKSLWTDEEEQRREFLGMTHLAMSERTNEE
jgi:DNA adenine methylase